MEHALAAQPTRQALPEETSQPDLSDPTSANALLGRHAPTSPNFAPSHPAHLSFPPQPPQPPQPAALSRLSPTAAVTTAPAGLPSPTVASRAFVLLMDALTRFKTYSTGDETAPSFSYQVLEPRSYYRQIERGGLTGWSFLNEEEISSSWHLQRSWRLMRMPLEDDPERMHGKIWSARSALIVELRLGNSLGWWVEIERRHNEGGYKSTFFTGPSRPSEEWFIRALGVIARARGRRLDGALTRMNDTYVPIRIGTYQHAHVDFIGAPGSEPDTDSSGPPQVLDLISVHRFLGRFFPQRELAHLSCGPDHTG